MRVVDKTCRRMRMHANEVTNGNRNRDLSVTSAQSCGSCHSPNCGWGDGYVGVGHDMHKLGRHSPTVVNAA
jgi:hypothetical protein